MITEQQIRDEAEKIQDAFKSLNKLLDFHSLHPFVRKIKGHINSIHVFCDDVSEFLSQQGEGKGMDYEKIGHRGLPQSIQTELENAAPESIKNDKGFGNNNLHTIWSVAACYGYRTALERQSPFNAPEVKENDAELNKFASTLSLASLRDQPKPEKTAEEILHDNHVNIGVLKIAQNRDGIPGTEYDRIVLSMKEYASQSSSSLRDALIDADDTLAYLEDFTHGADGDRITKTRHLIAKALIINNTDKKE